MKKRLFALFMILALTVLLLPASAAAEDAPKAIIAFNFARNYAISYF